jgi:DNA invertase Pin-like site-specific DNA recombinase
MMTKSEQRSLALGSQSKIRAEHLQRLAYIYIRQSSAKQVEHHRESQFNQRQLVERAEALGWHRDRIHTIDVDQGLSGKGSDYRQGFQELVAELSLGQVGIIFGVDASRLARNNRDWYHLLDLAAVFGTLIADCDGIYDPRLYNDRLLLGLKGTMSEAELHLLHQRLDGGRISQVMRGEFRQVLPTGLVRLPDHSVVKDPDDQVRHVIELVFLKFEELGSCGKVMRYFRDQDLLLPRRHVTGPSSGQLVWRPASAAMIRAIIHNPAYAGAFAYGRRQTDPTRRRPGQPRGGIVHEPIEDWIHLQQDVYPAYITWGQYLTNQERLRQNAMRFDELQRGAQGAVREGVALLQGLATCGVCGCKMRVNYKHNPLYVCIAVANEFGGPTCMSAHGPAVDAVVVQAFFDVIRPAQLDALAAILAAQQAERQRLAQQWEERLKRARYEVHLAERQYNAVDPDNRLVAAELERRWEEKLRQLQETRESAEHFYQTPPVQELAVEMREQFRRISETLPQLWPQLSPGQQKELLRSLISYVVLTKETPDRIEVKIVWVSGHYSVAYARHPAVHQHEVSGYEEMVKRLETLWEQGFDDAQIAAQLTAEGFHTARSSDVGPSSVVRLRRVHGLLGKCRRAGHILTLDGQLTVHGLADRLGVDPDWVYRRIYDRTIEESCISRSSKQRMYLIREDPELTEKLRKLWLQTHHT